MKNHFPFFIAENIDSGAKSQLRWVEDSAPIDFELPRHQEFLSLSLPAGKLRLFLLLIFLGVFLLFAKSFYLQIIKGNYYFSLAENNRIKTEYVKAHRGIIYDRAGKMLVRNVFGFSVLITPAELNKAGEKKEEILRQVAEIAEVDLNELRDRVNKADKYYFEPITVKTGVGYERAMYLKILSADMPGVSLEIDAWRHYPMEPAFSHLLGYVGKISAEEYEANQNYLFNDNIGKTGLEKYYETELRGRHGYKQIEVDAFGREKKIISENSFVAGSDLILAIDADLQNKAYEAMKSRLGESKVGAVIISNPQNGEILALVDYPSYDNNLFSLGISQKDYADLLADGRKPLLARSIAGEYPSGSTIKPVMASAGLQEKIIDRNTSVNSVGGIWYDEKWFFPDWKAGGHGATNVTKAIAWSVNTFFYYLGGGYGNFKGLGLDLMVKYFKLFGLGEKTGIDLPGEKTGFVPTKDWKENVRNEPWYIGDTYHLSIGQGDLLVTPIQVNNYTSAVANGGTLFRLHLVKAVVGADGIGQAIVPQIIRQNFVIPENINIVRAGMRETITIGSAQGLGSLPVAVAGKTGTAQWSSVKANHAWFTGFAPYENPTFAITVLVEEGGEGSSIAVPIAGEIMDYWFGRK